MGTLPAGLVAAGLLAAPLTRDEPEPAGTWPHHPGSFRRWSWATLNPVLHVPVGESVTGLQLAANAKSAYHGNAGRTRTKLGLAAWREVPAWRLCTPGA